MRRWDGYLDRAELIIIEAMIPLSLVYLPQPLTVVSSPRQYLGCGHTSAQPYSPLRSYEGAQFLQMRVEFRVSPYHFLERTVVGESSLSTADRLLS